MHMYIDRICVYIYTSSIRGYVNYEHHRGPLMVIAITWNWKVVGPTHGRVREVTSGGAKINSIWNSK